MTDDDDKRLRDLWGWSEQVGQTGWWEHVLSESEPVWSDGLYRIFGVEPGGPTSLEYLLSRIHFDDRDRLAVSIEQFRRDGTLQSVDYRIMRPDGQRRHLRSTLAVAEWRDDRPHRVVGVVVDQTDSRHAEREIAAHVAVEEALAQWTDLESGAHGLLARLGAALDCIAGVFWVPLGDVLIPRVFWHESGLDPDLEAETRARPLRRSCGLPGRAWEAGKPLSWTLGSPASPDTPDDEPAGVLKGAIAFPALDNARVLAVVELRIAREISVGERLMRSLYGISHELGHFLSRRGGELAAQLLTPREIEVLQLAAEGLSAPETAERLTVSAGTVRTHLENIYFKLHVSDKPSAVATALRLGLID